MIVGNVNVRFPYDAYDVQVALIAKIIEALNSNKPAILESPTGTGKTLCLLCACLAWKYSTKANNKVKIIYASRTHAQLEQVLGELKKTAYSEVTNVLLLSARDGAKTGCVHKHVKAKKGNEQILACGMLKQHKNCSFYEGLYSYLADASHRVCKVQDIEDMVQVATTSSHFCPYFFTRDEENLSRADLICMPYAYLVAQETRKNLKLDWENCIVIIDEAHNIEDACEAAYSFSLTSAQLAAAISELDVLLLLDRVDQSIVTKTRVAQLKLLLLKVEKTFTSFCALHAGESFAGGDIYSVLCEAGVGFENAAFVLRTLTQAMSQIALCHGEGDSNPPSTKHLELLLKALRTLFYMHKSSVIAGLVEEASGNAGELAFSTYQSAIVECAGNFFRFQFSRPDQRAFQLDYLCFTAAMTMHELENNLKIKNLLFASGTLSPISSFATSLQLSRAHVALENAHVVSSANVCVGLLGKGPTGYSLNGSYENRSSVRYVDELGRALVSLLRAIPDGALVFFSSYAALELFHDVWRGDGTLKLVEEGRKVFVEAKGLGANEQRKLIEDYDRAVQSGGGAVLFSVCRGKSSEGMDFSDARARGVIVVDLPFPNMFDLRVKEKKRYLNEFALRKFSGFTGNEWYVQSAYRAVNQACGRVIRHAKDFGAIFFLGDRFSQSVKYFSKWIQANFTKLGFDDAIITLRRFFHAHLSPPAPREKQAGNLSTTTTTLSVPSSSRRVDVKPSLELDPSLAGLLNKDAQPRRAEEEEVRKISPANDKLSVIASSSRTSVELLKKKAKVFDPKALMGDFKSKLSEANYAELKSLLLEYGKLREEDDAAQLHRRVDAVVPKGYENRMQVLCELSECIPRRFKQSFILELRLYL